MATLLPSAVTTVLEGRTSPWKDRAPLRPRRRPSQPPSGPTSQTPSTPFAHAVHDHVTATALFRPPRPHPAALHAALCTRLHIIAALLSPQYLRPLRTRIARPCASARFARRRRRLCTRLCHMVTSPPPRVRIAKPVPSCIRLAPAPSDSASPRLTTPHMHPQTRPLCFAMLLLSCIPATFTPSARTPLCTRVRVGMPVLRRVHTTSASLSGSPTHPRCTPTVSPPLRLCPLSAHPNQYLLLPILANIEPFVDKYKMRKYIKLQHELTHAKWDAPSGKRTVRIRHGIEEFEDSCDVLLLCIGCLNRWQWPNIERLKEFGGTLVHTTFTAEERKKLKDPHRRHQSKVHIQSARTAPMHAHRHDADADTISSAGGIDIIEARGNGSGEMKDKRGVKGLDTRAVAASRTSSAPRDSRSSVERVAACVAGLCEWR
ncbi:hypothetical protein DFH08DRAFT_954735 [Mycena albidolilacea]|uniref:Uncharacterized protein n=1 Tax=Mycena albidolilacea TaxID=1033008 RepID=A0AAD7ADU8_9AGAR|nr:hypothetical protein DFH08DRAFT_954735 [Mycena albidolilacea]